MSVIAGIRVSRRYLLLTSLLIVVLASSLFVCIFMMNGCDGISLEHVIHVKNEDELKNMINNTVNKKSTVVALDNDITLTETLRIPDDKDITITSNKATEYYKLIGAEGKSTVFVDGKGILKLDGIIITHVNHRGPELGGGVYVAEGGWLIMCSGEISGNSASDVGDPFRSASSGGGVYNLGIFDMQGGKISNNIVSTTGSSGAPGGGCGGGVYNHGIFTMSGGEISNNNAVNGGGGVSNGSNASFERLGGVISGNTASNGNDVYPDGGSGGSSNGNGELYSSSGFSLRDIVFICVGVALVVVGVVVAVLLFTFKKELKYTTKEKTI
ncbi:MAG: hypothetical protein LBB87_00315 [Nitrososphaerota archaeon]|nr:hypothetical protein [Nitrososphaerota archaeon]